MEKDKMILFLKENIGDFKGTMASFNGFFKDDPRSALSFSEEIFRAVSYVTVVGPIVEKLEAGEEVSDIKASLEKKILSTAQWPLKSSCIGAVTLDIQDQSTRAEILSLLNKITE